MLARRKASTENFKSNGDDEISTNGKHSSPSVAIPDKVQLSVVLPSGQTEHLLRDGHAPVMDVLIGICASHRLNPADYVLVQSARPGRTDSAPIEARPNQAIGALVASDSDKDGAHCGELRLVTRRQLAESRPDSVYFVKKQAERKNSVQSLEVWFIYLTVGVIFVFVELQNVLLLTN